MDSVRQIRKARGLSQQKLAERAGVNKITVVHLENDRHSPTVDTLKKLADALECEVADFFPKREPSLFDAPAQWGRSDAALGTLPPLEQGEPSEAPSETRGHIGQLKPISGPSSTTEGAPSDAAPRYSLGFISDTKPYFKKVERGEMTAEEAIRELEREYATA